MLLLWDGTKLLIGFGFLFFFSQFRESIILDDARCLACLCKRPDFHTMPRTYPCPFWKLYQINKQLVITRTSPSAHNTKVCKSPNPLEKCLKRTHGIVIVWVTRLLIKQYFVSYKMQNQQDADCKPKQSYEFYLTVVFMIAVPWNTLSVSYIGTCLYISYLLSWGSNWK